VTLGAWPEATPAAEGAWLAPGKARTGGRVRVFCFPYAGGGASLFRVWSSSLPAEVELWPVQLPGRENRLHERPFRRMDALARALADALTPHLEIPFAFFGHSMGALVAFELARELRHRGRPGPTELFVSGHRAPDVPDDDPPIHALEEPRFVDEVQRLNGTPAEVVADAELLALVLPALRADFEVCETYEHAREEPLACPIIAFGGLDDRKATRDRLAAWRDHTRARFSLRMFPGDHFFLARARDEIVATVVEELALAGVLAAMGAER